MYISLPDGCKYPRCMHSCMRSASQGPVAPEKENRIQTKLNERVWLNGIIIRMRKTVFIDRIPCFL